MQNVTYSIVKIYDLCKALDKELEEFVDCQVELSTFHR